MGSKSVKLAFSPVYPLPSSIIFNKRNPIITPILHSLHTSSYPPPPPPPPPPYKPLPSKIPPHTRNLVWSLYHSTNTIGVCYCCGSPINRYHAGWHCSHVIAASKRGSINVDNLRTCCRFCNLSMGDQNLYAYIKLKHLRGPGSKLVSHYLSTHPSQVSDLRTNNWRKN